MMMIMKTMVKGIGDIPGRFALWRFAPSRKACRRFAPENSHLS